MTPAAYRRALDALLKLFLSLWLPEIERMIDDFDDDEQLREALAEALTDAIREYRREAWTLAEQFMQEQAIAQGRDEAPDVAPPRGYADEAVDTFVDAHLETRDIHDTTDERLAEMIAETSMRHIQNAARDAIADTVDGEDLDPDADDYDDRRSRRPVAWARVLTGADNCSFCVMLASRGAIYESRRTALYDEDMQKYHNGCDCLAVPVYTSADWPGKDIADGLYDEWLAVTKDLDADDARRAWRRYLAAKQREGIPIVPNLRAAA